MLRAGLLFVILALTALGLCQDFTENWRAITSPAQAGEKIQWNKIITTATNEVVVFGIAINGDPPPAPFGPSVQDQTATVIVAKFSDTGAPLWVTRDFTGLPEDVQPLDLDVDGAGNVYVAYTTSNFNGEIASYAAATGTERWTTSFATDPENDQAISLAVRSAGNSTFVYAGVDVSGTLSQLFRLNSGNGTPLQTLSFTGGQSSLLGGVEADANGNVIFGLAVDGVGEIRKVNQGFTPVWQANMDSARPPKVAINLGSNTVLATSEGTFQTQTRVRSFNATNGTTVAQLDFPFGKLFPETRASVFGSWWASTVVEDQPAMVGFTATLTQFAFARPPKTLRDISVDSSGQVHFVARGDNPLLFAIRRQASPGLFQPTNIGTSTSDCTAVDGLGRVVAAGRVITGEAVVFQLDQPFLANTDVFTREFTGGLSVEAPGVLVNDTNWVGGTLSVTTPPAEGSVTLNQDGSFVFTPNGTYDGTDQFQYRITKNGVPRTATCVVKRLVITQLTMDNLSVIGEDFTSGKLTINNGSFPFDFSPVITLSSPAAAVGAPILVSSGHTQTQFTLRTFPVSAATAVNITATGSGVSKTASFTVLPGGLKDIKTVSGAPLLAGGTSIGTVTLTGTVTEDRRYNLFYQGMGGPGSVTIPAGSDHASITLTASESGIGTTPKMQVFTSAGVREFSFTIQARPKLSDFHLVGTQLYAGTPFKVEAVLDGKAGTSALSVPLSVSSNQVTLAQSVVVVPNATSGKANGTANLAAANTNVLFTAIFEGVTKQFTILCRDNLLLSLNISPATINRRSTSTGTVNLGWLAPPGGQTVGISTDRPDLVSIPSKIVVAAGQTTFAFTITPKGPAGSASISATIGQKKVTSGITITQ